MAQTSTATDLIATTLEISYLHYGTHLSLSLNHSSKSLFLSTFISNNNNYSFPVTQTEAYFSLPTQHLLLLLSLSLPFETNYLSGYCKYPQFSLIQVSTKLFPLLVSPVTTILHSPIEFSRPPRFHPNLCEIFIS